MSTQQTLGLFGHLTHKANLKHTRYGWLRLTPAYSVHLVSDLLDGLPTRDQIVLDPFCGTGTTALVCAERGIPADTTDINPFLIWLANTKTRVYQQGEIALFRAASAQAIEAIVLADKPAWVPPLHQIEKWWEARTLQALGRALSAIKDVAVTASPAVADLLKIVFCRLLIEQANVSFAHQSMSFKPSGQSQQAICAEAAAVAVWRRASDDISAAAVSPIVTEPCAMLCDARHLTQRVPRNHYTSVITSPPYPNRMSYIRELRPYMYWLGYLQDGRQAGELDWEAIGGTWGCATSLVGKWKPEDNRPIPYEPFGSILCRIAERSPLLSRYVHKYFYDMVEHMEELFQVLRSGGTAQYIVGNSRFYDVVLPVEEIYAALFHHQGFVDVVVKTIRKRTSKKELYEYVVSARKP